MLRKISFFQAHIESFSTRQGLTLMAQFSFESYETLKKKLISFLSPLFRNNFLEKHSNKNLTQEPKALSRALSKLEKSQANQNSIYKFEGQQEG